jgi:hypothetical protein
MELWYMSVSRSDLVKQPLCRLQSQSPLDSNATFAKGAAAATSSSELVLSDMKCCSEQEFSRL